jgi:orotidine-5'-phosphate decarboxylase
LKKRKLRLRDRLIVVIDVDSKSRLMKILSRISGKISTVKLGLEMIYSAGIGVVDITKRSGYDVMLDAKIMDIPNTASRASSAIARLKPSMVTIHALGGRRMIEDSQRALKQQSEKELSIKPLLFGVTVLTSLDDRDLEEMGFSGGYIGTVKKLAGIALDAGVDGIICSPGEAGILRKEYGEDFFIATPGIRLEEDSPGDQKRFSTPEKAIQSGSDILIAGRSITGKEDMAGAVNFILGRIGNALGKENMIW